MDFKKATDELFSQIDHDDLAKALGVSVATIRQARLGELAKAHRSPPRGWEQAVLKLAEKQLAQYQTLIRNLENKH